MTSMLEYLAGLRKYGHRPVQIGEVIIGKTHYAAGEFVTPERGALPGSRAAAEGRNIPSENRIALMPMYRSDWVNRSNTGPTPELLPASYRRSSNTVYELNGELWYIVGYHTGRTNKVHAEDHDGVLWLGRLPVNDSERFGASVMLASVHWTESFETSMALASPQVRARIRQLA